MEEQATDSSVVFDPWSCPFTSNLAFFRGLFGSQPFQFKLGLKRAERDWFRLPEKRDMEVLRARSAILSQNHPPTVFWTPSADAIFTELTGCFTESSLPFESQSKAVEKAATLSRWWPPDFVLLHRDGSNGFRMVGGVVCFPSGWAPEEKLGQSIHQIHEPVPGLNELLGNRIETFLGRLTPRNSFDRLNWGLAPYPDRNRHPLNQMPLFTPNFPLEKAWLRVEHQSFHALPQTGGIVFLIHLTIHPMGELVRDDQVASGVVEMLQSMSEEVARYKGLAEVRESWVRWLICRQTSRTTGVPASPRPRKREA